MKLPLSFKTIMERNCYFRGNREGSEVKKSHPTWFWCSPNFCVFPSCWTQKNKLVLNPAEKINKSCFGVIFTAIKNEWYLFICELKSKKPYEAEYVLQFRNTHVFIKFIGAILEEFYGVNLIENGSVRYILFDKQQSNRYNNTTLKNPKIEPEPIVSDNKTFLVYKVHHFDAYEFINSCYAQR